MDQITTAGCLSHGRGFSEECNTPNCTGKNFSTASSRSGTAGATTIEERSSIESKQPGRPRKDSDTIRDAKSTGRKRAAVEYPIEDGKSCEWQGLTNCGGGRYPITGCIDGLQENRHHGPDKDTLNNSNGNVHRICSRCHNLWHARNDKYTVEELAKTLHEPHKATHQELLNREIGRS